MSKSETALSLTPNCANANPKVHRGRREGRSPPPDLSSETGHRRRRRRSYSSYLVVPAR